ncbi:MAG: tRNA (adenosine(37)-N6)-threonylcarbamoyltransferase complex transferase subunit TsaD [Parasporobacterium sp.]|nr:tRNA (adenosine(37)-N6)-threonylcarbamoyltransferase complex transferase subunit TsaD [Parasporobacterium sp.]
MLGSKKKKDILVLGIESSCDETAAAVTRNGTEILSNVIYSQIDLHTLYGGVVPEIASRMHIAKINQVIKKALHDAQVTLEDLNAVAVTYGPGLVGALLVGVSEAKAIAWAKDLDLVGVNHIKGHVCANYIEHPDLEPPFLCLVASGGHTHLVKALDHTTYEIIGRTRDDAAGEAYDKIARAIGLGYPGGPKVEKAAQKGNPEAFAFPRARIDENPYDFSFSGVKSAVLNTINSCRMKGMEPDEAFQADVAASFQAAVIDSLRERVLMALEEFQIHRFAMAGGVASNQALRGALKEACEQKGAAFYCPSPVYCTDNAAMIAVAGYYEYMNGNTAGLDLNAVPGLRM